MNKKIVGIILFCFLVNINNTYSQEFNYTSDTFRLFKFDLVYFAKCADSLPDNNNIHYFDSIGQLEFLDMGYVLGEIKSNDSSKPSIISQIDKRKVKCLMFHSFFYENSDSNQFVLEYFSRFEYVNTIYLTGYLDIYSLRKLNKYFPILENIILRPYIDKTQKEDYEMYDAVSQLTLKRLFIYAYRLDRKVARILNKMKLEEIGFFDPQPDIILPKNAFQIEGLKILYLGEIEMKKFNNKLFKNSNLTELYLNNPRMTKLNYKKFLKSFPNLRLINVYEPTLEKNKDKKIKMFLQQLNIKYLDYEFYVL